MDENDKPYFAYSASLRIFGNISDIGLVTSNMGFAPTYSHRRGERRSTEASPFEHDMWSFAPDVSKSEHLAVHIDALWQAIRPRRDYLKGLKQDLTVDVFLGYRSDCDHAGLDLPHTSLEMFSDLEVPFSLSIIIA